MGVVTLKVLRQRIADGRGQGFHDEYLPWIWIRRKNSSRRGNQVVDQLAGYRRECHFLSLVEWFIAMLCMYLGAHDVREQFPLWPHKHVHPLELYKPASGQAWSGCEGLLAIAEELQVRHGTEIGSDVPYVATLDLMVTLRRASGFGLAGISIKPFELIVGKWREERVVERLMLERRCMQSYGAHYKVVDRSLLGPATQANLEFFSSAQSLPANLRAAELQEDFAYRFTEAATQNTVDVGIRRAGKATSLGSEEANLLWRHLVWRRRIDLDITRALNFGAPLRTGGRVIADALSRELFGEVL